MKFLHTADLHLSDQDSLECLQVIVARAEKEKCAYILIAGDMFDKDSSYLAIEQQVLQILEGFSGEILILPGNHDAGFLAQRKTLSRNSRVFTPDQILYQEKLGEVTLWAIPFREDSDMSRFADLETDARSSILMAHGTYYSNSFFYNDEHKVYFPIFEKDLRDRFAYVALGHYHRPILVQLGATQVVNPGAPRITRASDLGPRQAALVDTSGWSVVMIDLPLSYIQPLDLHVTPGDSLETINGRLDALLRQSHLQTAWARVQVHFMGILSPDITLQMLRDQAEVILKNNKLDFAPPELRDVAQLQPELLQNSYVQNLLQELDRQAREQGLDGEALKAFSLARLQSILQ